MSESVLEAAIDVSPTPAAAQGRVAAVTAHRLLRMCRVEPVARIDLPVKTRTALG
jgi:hypothetical protein